MPGCHRVGPGAARRYHRVPAGESRGYPKEQAEGASLTPRRSTRTATAQRSLPRSSWKPRGNQTQSRWSQAAPGEPVGTTVGRQGGSEAPNRDDGGVLLTASGPGRRQLTDDSCFERGTGNHRGRAGGFTGMAKTGRKWQSVPTSCQTPSCLAPVTRLGYHRESAGV